MAELGGPHPYEPTGAAGGIVTFQDPLWGVGLPGLPAWVPATIFASWSLSFAHHEKGCDTNPTSGVSVGRAACGWSRGLGR